MAWRRRLQWTIYSWLARQAVEGCFLLAKRSGTGAMEGPGLGQGPCGFFSGLRCQVECGSSEGGGWTREGAIWGWFNPYPYCPDGLERCPPCRTTSRSTGPGRTDNPFAVGCVCQGHEAGLRARKEALPGAFRQAEEGAAGSAGAFRHCQSCLQVHCDGRGAQSAVSWQGAGSHGISCGRSFRGMGCLGCTGLVGRRDKSPRRRGTRGYASAGEDNSAYDPGCETREPWTDFYSSPPGCLVVRHTPSGECRRGPLHGYGDDAAGARAFPYEPGRRVAPSSTARPPESWASAAATGSQGPRGQEVSKGRLGSTARDQGVHQDQAGHGRWAHILCGEATDEARRIVAGQGGYTFWPWCSNCAAGGCARTDGRQFCDRGRRSYLLRGWTAQFIGPGNDRGRRRRSSIRSWGQGTAFAGRDLTGCVERSQGRSQLRIYPSTLREPLDGGASLGKLLLSSLSLGEYCGSGAVRRVNWRSLRRRVQLFCTVAFLGFDGYFLRPAMIGKAQAVTRLNHDREAARPPGLRETLGDVSPFSNAFFRLPGVYAGLEVVSHARKGFPRGSGLCGFRYSGVVDLRGPFQPHDPRDAYIFPFLGPCSPVSSGWNFDRRPSFASFKAMERCSRCQRGLSVAQGFPPTSSFVSGCLQASQVASLSLQGIGESRCLRGLSVARGSPPAMSFADSVDALRAPVRRQCPSIGCYIGKSCLETLSRFILWCGAFVVPCMRSLGLCLFISLIGALRRSVSVRLLSVRRARRIMLAGTDLWPLHSLGVIASPCHQPVLTWAPYRTHARGCKPRIRPVPKKGFLYRLLVHICVTYLYGTLPCCVWAAPKGISNLQSISEVIADRVPEAMPDTASLNLGSPGPPASCARAGAETWSDTVARMQDQALYDTFSERLDPPVPAFSFPKARVS